jgi:GNAT superfamily N-acetyltransferase
MTYTQLLAHSTPTQQTEVVFADSERAFEQYEQSCAAGFDYTHEQANVDIHLGISKVLAAQQGAYLYTRVVCVAPGGRVVGTGSCIHPRVPARAGSERAVDGNVPMIEEITVLPQEQRKGYATFIMQKLLLYLRGLGHSAALLDATPAGQHVYLRLGFSALPHYIGVFHFPGTVPNKDEKPAH